MTSDAPRRHAGHLLATVLLGLLRLVVPLAILAAGVFAARALVATRPEPPRTERAPQAAAVETMVAEAETRRAIVDAFGTVQPHRRLEVRTQVSGIAIEQHPELIAGGVLEEGALLLRIDPRDYEFRVREEEAALVRAEFELTLEQGRQLVAAREWNLLGDSVERTALGEELALRRPHLKEKEAAAAAARSRLERARLDLDRTRIDVPFNALVLSESIESGQLVGLQTTVAELACVDDYHVRVSVPVSQLDLVRLPDLDGEHGSPATVINETGDGVEHRYPGRVVRLLGEVDPAGRMARLLVQVDDPLGLAHATERSDTRARPPLLLGEFVRVHVEGPEAADVVPLPRRALREGGRIWIMDAEDRLQVREIEVAWGTDDEIVVAAGLEPGERVIVSPLAAPVPGMPLVDVAAALAPATDDADREDGAR